MSTTIKAKLTRYIYKYGVISGPYFPVFGPEITPYLDTFYILNAVLSISEM